MTTGVVTGLLSTVLGGTSDTPSDSPAEWALLAAARREIGASTETTTTTAAAAAVTTSEVAAPSAMDTIAGAQPQLEVTGSIPAGSSPSGVNVGLLGNKLYITNRDTDTVTVVDRTTGAVIATIAVGDAPSAVDATLTISSPPFSGTSQWIYQAYVANSGSGTVTVLDSTDSVIATVKVGTNPVAVAQSPEGNRVWVVNAGSDSVTKINTVTNTVTTTIKVGGAPQAGTLSADGSTRRQEQQCRRGDHRAGHRQGRRQTGRCHRQCGRRSRLGRELRFGHDHQDQHHHQPGDHHQSRSVARPGCRAQRGRQVRAYVAKNTTNDVAVITVQSNAVKTITDVGVSPVSVILGGGGKGT